MLDFNKLEKQDFFLSEENMMLRLWSEYKLHGKLVVAYDYDNTVFDYHNKGYTFEKVIDLIRRCKKLGFYLIVFTGSNSTRFGEISQYLNENDIPFDAINENPPFFKSDSRKIFFNIILDDRAGLPSAYNVLKDLVDNAERIEKLKELGREKRDPNQVFGEMIDDFTKTLVEKRPYLEYFKVTDTEILGFFEDYRFLSNYHVADVYYNGELYPSTEHAYQAAKFLNADFRKQFMDPTMTCGKSRKLGQTKNEFFDPQWDEHKYDVMLKVVFDKFERHLDLREKLLATGDKTLVELNHWGDVYWGVDFRSGIGESNLGNILMAVRGHFKNK